LQELPARRRGGKIRLSADERTALTIPFDAFTYHREIARAELEQLIERLVANTLRSCRMALADAGLSPADINEVVLSAGSTRVPLVRPVVGELFAGRPTARSTRRGRRPGAAFRPTFLAGGITDMPCSTSPRYRWDRDARRHRERADFAEHDVPTSAREMFTDVGDGQRVVDMHVVQGERELAKDCRSLARFELSGIDPMPAACQRSRWSFSSTPTGSSR